MRVKARAGTILNYIADLRFPSICHFHLNETGIECSHRLGAIVYAPSGLPKKPQGLSSHCADGFDFPDVATTERKSFFNRIDYVHCPIMYFTDFGPSSIS